MAARSKFAKPFGDDFGNADFIEMMHGMGQSAIMLWDKRHVCGKCLDDPGVGEAILHFGAARRCDFCGTRYRSDKAAPIGDIAAFVMGCLFQDYDIPENVLFRDSESENGWSHATQDRWELVQDYLDGDWGAIEALIQCVTDDDQWVESDPGLFLPGQRLGVSWESFSRYVRHRSRFMFLREDEQPRGVSDAPDDSYVPANAMLDLIGGAVVVAGMVRTLRAGTRLYRARRVATGQDWHRTADALGPPPESETGPPAGRMNAAGIPVFYAALDLPTALGEAVGSAGRVALGTFSPTRNLRILDLTRTDGLKRRTIFENVSTSARGLPDFIEAFTADVSTVTARDGREHIDYVPAQIVTEYFRRVFVTADGARLDGIIYPSTRNADGRNVALFFDRRDIEGISWRDASLRFHRRLVRRFNVRARKGVVTGWEEAG